MISSLLCRYILTTCAYANNTFHLFSIVITTSLNMLGVSVITVFVLLLRSNNPVCKRQTNNYRRTSNSVCGSYIQLLVGLEKVTMSQFTVIRFYRSKNIFVLGKRTKIIFRNTIIQRIYTHTIINATCIKDKARTLFYGKFLPESSLDLKANYGTRIITVCTCSSKQSCCNVASVTHGLTTTTRCVQATVTKLTTI